MSALGQKRTSCLLDDLVSAGKQRSWNCDVQRFSSLHIDRGLELGRLKDGQIGWLFAIENAADINPDLTKDVGLVWSVARESTRQNIFARIVHGRQHVTGCQS